MLIAYKEKTTLSDEYKHLSKVQIIEKIQEIDNQYEILKHLSAIALTSKEIQDSTNKKTFDLYVMYLDVKNNSLFIRGFAKKTRARS